MFFTNMNDGQRRQGNIIGAAGGVIRPIHLHLPLAPATSLQLLARVSRLA